MKNITHAIPIKTYGTGCNFLHEHPYSNNYFVGRLMTLPQLHLSTSFQNLFAANSFLFLNV
jgi:hypothetical protein